MLTGKSPEWSGALVLRETTGYGTVYFVEEMLRSRGESLEGRVCTESGSGNVAIHAIEKLQQLGAKVVPCSDSNGVIRDERGVDLQVLKQIKEVERRRLSRYVG